VTSAHTQAVAVSYLSIAKLHLLLVLLLDLTIVWVHPSRQMCTQALLFLLMSMRMMPKQDTHTHMIYQLQHTLECADGGCQSLWAIGASAGMMPQR
jgi:hypothetical protein